MNDCPPAALVGAHRAVQQAAKTVLSALASRIRATDTEASLAADAHRELTGLGYPETWYYACPALVLAGARSCLSVSGRDYVPDQVPIGNFNLVTIDLSPLHQGIWGDCARSFYVENGRAVPSPQVPEWRRGQAFLSTLHDAMRRMIRPDMSFHELFEWTGEKLREGGLENLDQRGNVGHSIASRRDSRRYVEAGNHGKLGDVPFFTFEPHVREQGGRWGFKHEDIFYFDQHGHLQAL